ncbi:4'-phosphopantetheinyl transferase superfamily protein [Marinilabiliaceae bacterium ANBcel2]|nr:4'-phosphopantetheinyl transferase superfamily protein [Marinilabiliaceae bacterium ANBcel2]
MPLIIDKIESGVKRFAVWQIEEEEEELMSLIDFTPELGKQLKAIRDEGKRREWLASRILLNKLSGFSPSVSYNSYGQPYIKGRDCSISITHTKNYAAVILSDKDSVGIDIEYPSNRIKRVAPRFLNMKEMEFAQKSSVADDSLVYGLIWCAKEVLYKVAGMPGLAFREDIEVFSFELAKEGFIKARIKRREEYLLRFLAESDFYLVWY